MTDAWNAFIIGIQIFDSMLIYTILTFGSNSRARWNYYRTLGTLMKDTQNDFVAEKRKNSLLNAY